MDARTEGVDAVSRERLHANARFAGQASVPPPIAIRRARELDQAEITTLVHSERLNPIDLDWRRFIVAVKHARVVGAVQLRRHFDGSRELGSLVVRTEMRGRGLAARLIDALLAGETGRVLMITRVAFARRYEHWGFRPIASTAAPLPILRNYAFGVLAGVVSMLTGRRPNRLVVLDRHARQAAHSG